MKSEDFRIGNIVNHQEYKSILQGKITSISPYRVGIDNRTGIKLNSENLIPIPLTEEWLLKFHYSSEEIEISKRFPNEMTIYDRFLFIWKPEYKYWYVVTAYHKEYLTKIEFVHEYQNFIFTLMDIELTLK
jgi:hypothetical protein